MKLFIRTLSLGFPTIFFGALTVLLLLNSGCATGAVDSAGAPAASGGITDAEIRDVVHRVAQHQIRPLKDGEYTSVTATNALQLAQAAAAPVGIGWSYPWGVTLYGMLRSTDVTGDADAEKFVLEH